MNQKTNLTLKILVLFSSLTFSFIFVSIFRDGSRVKVRSEDFISSSMTLLTYSPTKTDTSNSSSTIRINMTVPSWFELENTHTLVLPGGQSKPVNGNVESKIAIIVPYRNRESQLRVFLKHIHPFLIRQSLNYRVFVVELDKEIPWNKGVLFNAGFLEASKIDLFDCLILHDVDLLPEDSRNNYTCDAMPRHHTSAIDKFKYKLYYQGHFGGVVAISAKQFQLVNGFSNMYYGWGCEDDDFYRRVRAKKLKVMRYPQPIARYKMIRHAHDQPRNPKRLDLLRTASARMAWDGLNNVTYKVMRLELRPLYTWVLVTFNYNSTLVKFKHL